MPFFLSISAPGLINGLLAPCIGVPATVPNCSKMVQVVAVHAPYAALGRGQCSSSS